jgi:hypothetical protein
MKFDSHKDGTGKITSTEFIAVGWTEEGLQIVCENCGKNVIDLDFLGHRVAIYKNGKEKRGRLAKTTDNGKKPSVPGKK